MSTPPSPTPSNNRHHISRPTTTSSSPNTQSAFEQQREELVGEIALSLEQVLQNINRLNRNLEGVIAVGNEFSSVEALWSQFENVMGRDVDGEASAAAAAAGSGGGGDGGQGERSGSGSGSGSGEKGES